ncbi:MAG: ComF family protein [Oscillospiraceae bacterium]|nr:ComF family protein [Oscillospiraceae bacterium]
MKPFTGLLNLLFPPRCTFCGKLLWKPDGDDSLACHECRPLLPRLTGADCESRGDFFTACISPFLYQDMVRTAVLRMKFGRTEALTIPLGHYIATCLQEEGSLSFDCISWVPLSKKRRAQRGFDQARGIAKQIAEDLRVPLIQVLDKVRDAAAQSSMQGRDARRSNIKGAYTLHPGMDVAGKRILLIDDVITTGSTLSECARVLLEAGADMVCAATFAKTPENRKD